MQEARPVYFYRSLDAEVKADVLRNRQLSGYPLHSPPHLYSAGGSFLITAATCDHLPHFAMAADRTWLLGELLRALEAASIGCRAWVVLPNHYHLIVECAALRDVCGPLGRVHGRTSREVNRRSGVTWRRVWYRFSDRQIRGERHYYATLNYIHDNPVRHRYVQYATEWGASSVHWYLEHFGELRMHQIWQDHPLHAYGQGWDDF